MYLLNLHSTDASSSVYSKLSSLSSPCLVICALYIKLKAEPWSGIIIDVPLFSKPCPLPSPTVSQLINSQFYFLFLFSSLPQSHSIESIISHFHQYDFSKVEFFSFYALMLILAVVSLLYSGKSHFPKIQCSRTSWSNLAHFSRIIFCLLLPPHTYAMLENIKSSVHKNPLECFLNKKSWASDSDVAGQLQGSKRCISTSKLDDLH